MQQKLMVLLVEDDIQACEAIVDCCLSSNDITLTNVTNNSVKAIEMIQSYLPDAIILDLELHHGSGNGFQVLQGLKDLHLDHKPYILVTTNNTSAVMYETARQMGADFIMSKHQDDYSAKSVIDFLTMMKPVIQTHPQVGGPYTSVYVNGKPIEYQDSSLIYNSPEEYSLTQTDTLLNKESGKNFATANMRDIIWQSRPFSGYPATAFENNWHLVFPSKTIVFNQIIKSMTTGALVSVIGTRLVSFLSAASVAAATLLIGAGIDVMLSGIAEYYKSVAQRFAPSADSIAVSVKRAALVDPPVLDSYSRYFAAYALPVSTNRFNQERYFYSLNYFT